MASESYGSLLIVVMHDCEGMDGSLLIVVMHDSEGMDCSLPRAAMHGCEGMNESLPRACLTDSSYFALPSYSLAIKSSFQSSSKLVSKKSSL